MEYYENRVLNGLLKTELGHLTFATLTERLSADVSIVVETGRLRMDDLWPCIWALSKSIEKQFTGKIYIVGNPSSFLSGPSPLSRRVLFVDEIVETPITIGVGVRPSNKGDSICIYGDARASSISYGCLLDKISAAHPVSGFALAGYLGFAALANVAGIPEFREDFAQDKIDLPFSSAEKCQFTEEVTFIGLGQLGQAYLSLLFFLNDAVDQKVMLLDKDPFEGPNYNTQILLDESREWENQRKATFLAEKFRALGWNVQGEITELKWGWKRPPHHSQTAIVGLDNFEARRIVLNAGYGWMFEAGLGTSFLQPKISWHSVRAQNEFAYLFPDKTADFDLMAVLTQTEKKLRETTPGGCGLVTYKNIAASAPSMGLVAAAFLWCEILASVKRPVKGNAVLWSAILPPYRENISNR